MQKQDGEIAHRTNRIKIVTSSETLTNFAIRHAHHKTMIYR
jgi:hypothetical protein